MMKPISVIIAILAVLMLLCLAPMPYGYFQFVRLFSAIVFAYLAYKEYEKGNKELLFTFIGLALLFQPFIKVHLGRTLWNIVDVIVGIGLLVYLFYCRRNNRF